MSDDKKIKSSESVPRWVVGLPLAVVLIVAIVFAGGHHGFLSIVLFILGAGAFLYLYIYLVAVWRHRRTSRKA